VALTNHTQPFYCSVCRSDGCLATSHSDVIAKDPEVLHGTPVFRGTRVPVKALFDSLEAGETRGDFLEGFPSVTREMAVSASEQAHQLLAAKS
jgi:uncharacterized protein (DUF433 family)